MSIVTSKYFDVPRLPPEFEREIALEHDDVDDGCGHGHGHRAWSGSAGGGGGGKKRRFFESGAVWDPVKRVVVERAGVRPCAGCEWGWSWRWVRGRGQGG